MSACSRGSRSSPRVRVVASLAACLALSACGPFVQVMPRGPSSRAMIGGSGGLDLDDYNKEVHEGLHITSMAGTWLSVVEGFGGFNVRDGMPRFRGKLPAAWQGLRFKINFRNRLLDVVVSEEGTSVALIAGQPIDVEVNGQVKRLDAQGH